MSGMGIGDFLNNDPSGGSGRRGQFFTWKDKGSAVVWLHATAPIYFAWQHQFLMEDEVEDKDNNGAMKQILRFPRFISPDDPDICRKQFFRDKRNKSDLLESPPDRDPFLLLREWLRIQINTGALSPEAPVFEWWDPKNREQIVWKAGRISGLQESTKNTWNHSLDAKLQYTFAVVDNADLAAGVQISQESRAIGDAMRKIIAQQCDALGAEAGNPQINPYAFKWTFNDKAKIADMYGAYRFDKAVYTDDVYNAINGEAPDVERLVNPQDGDLAKIQAAFQSAMRLELPLSLIFSEVKGDREAVLRGATTGGSAPVNPPSQGQGRAPTVPAGTGGVNRPGAQAPQGAAPRPAAGKPPGQSAGAPPAATSAAPAGVQSRRKKVEAPPKPIVPVVPEPERIKCDDCDFMMLATDSKCGGCGAEYAVEESEATQPIAPTQVSGVRPPSGARPPAAASGGEPAHGTCFSCGSASVNRTTGVCGNCRMKDPDIADDDIPF